jgi:biotin-dependent carboxylase-like uncharacterized protein
VIEIVDPGLMTTVQDRGRSGLASIGVPMSGSVDPALAAHCNRLVGNPDAAAVLETVGGLTLRATVAVVVASDVEPVARTLAPGQTLQVAPGGRQWHYVAIRGGVDVVPTLGSRSSDTLSGLGPSRPRAGDILPVGPEPSTRPVGETWPIRPRDGAVTITEGPRADWFTRDASDALTGGAWTVTDASRVGVRLDGAPLHRTVERELPSEGLVRGAIQVPPDGAPIMMLADHPTTGGYPVIAVVAPDDVATVAQRRVGETLRFRR